MSASRSRATDTHLSSEVKARRRFLSIYLMLVLSLVSLASYFYYKSQEQLMFQKQRIQMMQYASEQGRKLKQLHRHYPQDRKYPRDSRFNSAIYDLEHQKIFSTLQGTTISLDEVIYNSGDMIHLVRVLDDYYMGAKYIVIEISRDRDWYMGIIWKISIFALTAMLMLLAFGFYLSRIFVRPMKESIILLDRFIKDTTHELNTPLSAILANIEMIDRVNMSKSNNKKINRIEIGTRTVSILYEDLKFLTLESSKKMTDEKLDILQLLNNRLEYFGVLLESKGITIHKELIPSYMIADKRLISRMIDNILSNAIKYNRRNGMIDITLRDGMLVIADTGIGIPKDKIVNIFDRYSRFDENEGGFGIGLNIVKKITMHYDIEVNIESEPNIGTKVVLQWKN